MLLSIVESLVILGLCFLFFPYSSACDVGMNMVCRVLSVVILDNQCVLPWLYHIHDHGHHRECPHSLHFVSPYRLLIFFIICSILLWFITFAVIAGFMSFPAENTDLYGTFFGLFSNFVSMLYMIYE